MYNYIDLLKKIKTLGEEKTDRTGTGTISLFGEHLKYDLNDGFPIVTTKYIHFKSVVHELLWFISGDTNTKYLVDNGVKIWNEWADCNGNLGPLYGKQWRNADGVDQLQYVIDELKTNPDSRRLVVDSWNVKSLPRSELTFSENVIRGRMALAPCHYSFQFVHYNRNLDLIWNQRSVDTCLGLPFNIASYALLLHMVSQIVGMNPRHLVFSGADCHIYKNHLGLIDEQLDRVPHKLPEIKLNPDIKNIDDFTFDDIELIGYEHDKAIRMPIAI